MLCPNRAPLYCLETCFACAASHPHPSQPLFCIKVVPSLDLPGPDIVLCAAVSLPLNLGFNSLPTPLPPSTLPHHPHPTHLWCCSHRGISCHLASLAQTLRCINSSPTLPRPLHPPPAAAAIRDFPTLDLPAPDIVLALHACDTATDEALAVGVLSGAQVIMSVPCCQKDIQRQFQRQQQRRPGSSSGSPAAQQQQQQVQQVFEPLLEHGILKQRQLDLLTDAFRAQLLQLAGYR